MNFSLRALSLVSSAAVLLATAGSASAATITGTVYTGIASAAGSGQGSDFATNGVTLDTLNAAINGGTVNFGSGNVTVAGATGSTTFTSDSINFSAAGIGGTNQAVPTNTLAYFLTSRGANVSGPALTSDAAATGNLIVLTGSVFLTNGATYDIFHDDGLSLYIAAAGTTTFTDADSVDVDAQPGQTVAGNLSNPLGQDFVYNGVTGDYSFEMLYVSNYEAPSTLIASGTPGFGLTAAPTPEPGSFILLGSGLLAAAGVVRRRMTV